MTTSTTLTTINSITQFVNTSQQDWDDVNLPVPNGAVIFTPNDGVVKVGDGVTLYANLPVAFTFSNILAILSTLATQQSQIANLQSQLTANVTPTRLILESFIANDGVTTILPWSVDNLNALDVYVDGVCQANSELNLIDGTQLQLLVAVAPSTPVRVVWSTEYNPANQSYASMNSILVTSSESWIGSGNLPDGSEVFQSRTANVWLTGQNLPNTDTEFVCLPASTWLPSGPGLVSGNEIIQGLPASTWLPTWTLTVDLVFNSLGVGTFQSTGLGSSSAQYLFTSLTSDNFQSSGGGAADANIIVTSVTAAAFA